MEFALSSTLLLHLHCLRHAHSILSKLPCLLAYKGVGLRFGKKEDIGEMGTRV